MSEPPQQNPYRAPIQDATQPHPNYYYGGAEEGDATGGLVPYKNPHALIAYYLGILALLPILGIPFGIAAIILGFIGLSKRKKNPKIRGSIHAWIGICCGFISFLCPFMMFGFAMYFGMRG